MAITGYSTVRLGGVTTVTAESDLTPPVYHHWWLDGVYTGRTAVDRKSFAIEPDTQSRIEAVDTNDADFDWRTVEPSVYPSRKWLQFLRSSDPNAASYLIGSKRSGWVDIGSVVSDGSWSYVVLTPKLIDLSDYEFRVQPLDAAGNIGAAVATDAQRVVRTPEAPDFTATYSAGTGRVTFALTS